MKFSGKRYLIIILKVTNNWGFTLSLKKWSFGKTTGRGVKMSTPAFLGLSVYSHCLDPN